MRIPTKLGFLAALVLGLTVGAKSSAGPVFSLIGLNPTTAPHPTGVGTRAASGSWGFSATGGGFLDGTLTFVDGFMLPGAPGGSVGFGVSDILGLSYRHQESAFIVPSPITPVFSFNANASQIVSASGSVVNNGGGIFTLFMPMVQTSAPALLFRLPGGIVAGDYYIDNDAVGILAASIGGIPQPPNTLAQMVTNSQATGVWRLTGTTQTSNPIPVPAALPLLASGLGLLGLLGWRRRRTRA